MARRARPGADTAFATVHRAVLNSTTLPRDTALVQPLLAAAMIAGDTAWLTTWAALQPTALARVAAYRELGLQSLLAGSSWLRLGHSENCLDE
jgi:hypothetical protein